MGSKGFVRYAKRVGLSSRNTDTTQINENGSHDIYFAPNAPDGKESNWIQTMPGKSWNVLLRLYGPEQDWFDKTWKPGDFELVE